MPYIDFGYFGQLFDPVYSDKADFNTNAKSYYDALARNKEFLKLFTEKLIQLHNELEKDFEDHKEFTQDKIDEFQNRLDGIKQEMIDFFNQWLADGALDEVINQDIFNQIEFNLLHYPRLETEQNDYNRVMRAINDMSNGDTLKFDGTIDFGKQPLTIEKSIKIIGKNWTSSIIKDGFINIRASNVHFENFFIDSPDFGDGIKANTTACENITIKKVMTNVASHGFLFESYNGLISDVMVEQCVAKNGLQGFISKATNVTFKDCKAYDIKNLAFGAIGDNIQGVEKIANCENTIIENCKAYRCGSGFTTYLRDMYNTSTSIKCKNIMISNLYTYKCNQGLSLGEETIPANYKAIGTIENITINNVTITESVFEYYGILVNNVKNVFPVNISCDSYIYFLPSLPREIMNRFNQNIIISQKVSSQNISDSNITFDLKQRKNFDLTITSPTTNTIDTINETDGDEITIMIRSTVDANNVFGGFSSKFRTPANLTFNIPFAECLVTKWIFNRWQNKFICTSVLRTRF